MNKIRVIKKGSFSLSEQPFESDKIKPAPSPQELVEVIGDWVADWRKRSELETRRALKACARFRMGMSLGTSSENGIV